MNEEELDTLSPVEPPKDPILEAIQELRGEIKEQNERHNEQFRLLVKMSSDMVEELQLLRNWIGEGEIKVRRLGEHVRHLTPPAGMPAQNGNGGDRG